MEKWREREPVWFVNQLTNLALLDELGHEAVVLVVVELKPSGLPHR